MAITQERMHKITQAGQHYQALWRTIERGLKKVRTGEMELGQLLEELEGLYEEPCHAETLTAEALHYKFTKHRNKYSKLRMAAKRAEVRGEEPSEELSAIAAPRPYNLKHPATHRKATDATPEIRKELPEIGNLDLGEW